MGREFELKYRATPDQIAAIRADFSGFREISMETTYYDTPDRKLSARKWTLRRRLENGVSVCTLKIPLPGGARGEWETPCRDILEAVPVLCKLGAPEDLASLTAGGLVRVCGARFLRRAALLSLEDCSLELALDQGVLLGGSRECSLQEVEVEAKTGSEEAAAVFARQLAVGYGLVPERASKYRRALDLAANNQP